MKPIIKIENLSKLYRVGELGTGTLSHDLNRWWNTHILHRADPYALLGSENDRSKAAIKGERIWALRDINLEINEGDVLGIIGKNGAGKSTLLKILSKVTSPTTGSIKYNGRLASLLEVGTGFHPELTGRENIYMNGTIMGMRKWEVAERLEEIVDFAGVAKYLDTPVKRYSSGMTVRLGFAVAAHLEPEILVVDEVLAVGDAEFQKRAIGKMQDVSSANGRTILFVSHNMTAVKSLCKTGIVLRNGLIDIEGTASEVVHEYLHDSISGAHSREWKEDMYDAESGIRLRSIKILPEGQLSIDQKFAVVVIMEKETDKSRVDMTLHIKNAEGHYLFGTSSVYKTEGIEKNGKYEFICEFPANFFNIGDFNINLLVIKDFQIPVLGEEDVLKFTMAPSAQQKGTWMGKSVGHLKPNLDWSILQ